ncbi:MAG: F0F1 ATP synthase subunit B' [Rhodobacterales bacterium]|jgi:F-type H+-transporting ATPase subunit b|tara:strand:- start:253 stop:777 length:525 start_codon:yes stop_codon:yes gene_type:complete
MAKTPSDVPVEPGMPQLDFTTFPNQMFWLFVTIVAIYFVLSKIALPRIGAVLSDRQDTIEHDLARAEELKQMAEDAEKAYNKALADARIEANNIINDTKLEMKAELGRKIADADLQIAERAKESEQKLNDIKAKAKSSILDVANEIAIDIVVKVSPGPIDEKLIMKSVSQKVTE